MGTDVWVRPCTGRVLALAAGLCAALCLSLSLGPSVHALDEHAMAKQVGVFAFDKWPGKALKVYYALPVPTKKLSPDTKVLFVMTGRKRNADDYRDQWQDAGARHGFIVLVPQFAWDDYPDEVSYDMGNVFRFPKRLSVPALDKIELLPEGVWAFSAIEPIFDEVRTILGLKTESYSMYGHSSGAGFVHRFNYYKPAARLDYAVAANGAWYLLPRTDVNYPYGLKGSTITKAMLLRAFSRKLTLMFGQDDLGPRKQYHANTPQAKSQGPHVVSRAMNYLLLSLVTAKQLDLPINWQLRSVPNVGHSNKRMVPHAVEHLFPDISGHAHPSQP